MAAELAPVTPGSPLGQHIRDHIAVAHRLRQLKAAIDREHDYDEARALQLIHSGEVCRSDMLRMAGECTMAAFIPAPASELLGVVVERAASLPRGNADLGTWVRHVVELLSEETHEPDSPEDWYGLPSGFSAGVVHTAMTEILATERWLPPPATVLAVCKAARLRLVHDAPVASYLARLAAQEFPEPDPDDDTLPPF